MRRSTRLAANTASNSSTKDAPSLQHSDLQQYKSYGRVIMNNNQWFNCLCNNKPDYSKLILCDHCGETWSHFDCVIDKDMDSYSLRKYVYCCFHCRRIFSDEDKTAKMHMVMLIQQQIQQTYPHQYHHRYNQIQPLNRPII